METSDATLGGRAACNSGHRIYVRSFGSRHADESAAGGASRGRALQLDRVLFRRSCGLWLERGDRDDAPADPTLFFDFDAATFNLDGNGIIGGAQVGYNLQLAPSWVIGVEADISGTGIRGSSFAPVTLAGVPALGGRTHYMSKEIEWLGTVRGRLGYTWDRWMVYATGGVAWAHAGGDLIPRNVQQIGNARGSHSSTKTGWTAGGGIEWAFGGNWTARAE